MNTTTGDKPQADDIESLLPWYAAGSLSYREAQRVEAALAHDPELARRYALVCEEMAGAVELNESLGAPPAHTLDQLFARIDAEPARRRPLRALGGHMAAFIASLSPGTLAWAAAAAALVIVVQSGLIGGVLLTQPATSSYRIASVPASPAAGGAFVLVRFQPQTSAADVTAFLEANHASIVEGPRAGGFYKLRVGGAGLSEAGLASIVRHLQNDRIISFVVPTR